jgi:SAM-dependent methyltransferase
MKISSRRGQRKALATKDAKLMLRQNRFRVFSTLGGKRQGEEMNQANSSRSGDTLRPDGGEGKISFRSTNPITRDENPHGVFCNQRQAKATTATRMFRSEEMFRAVRDIIVPHYSAKQTPGTLSIWSAGCSSGAETYSIAMTADSELKKLGKNYRLSLFGTDINPERITEAKAGEYLQPASHQLTPGYAQLLTEYTVSNCGRLKIKPEIKTLIKFGLFDIRKRPQRHIFDYIVCDHVLQYYDLEGQLEIIDIFKSVLKPGGRLYLEGLTPQSVIEAGLKHEAGYKRIFRI